MTAQQFAQVHLDGDRARLQDLAPGKQGLVLSRFL
jgi:hypothetical protein